MTTNNAQTLRFSDEGLRAQGRVGQGVAAMALAPGAHVVSASYLDSDALTDTTDPLSLFVITESGLGKKVPLRPVSAEGTCYRRCHDHRTYQHRPCVADDDRRRAQPSPFNLKWRGQRTGEISAGDRGKSLPASKARCAASERTRVRGGETLGVKQFA